PRILVAECMQEISSFNPLQSEYSNFHIERGHAMLAQKGINTGLGGALAVFDEVGFEPVLTISARAGSAGLLSRPGWNRLMGEVLEAIAAEAGSGIDAVYFSMHGAMAADGELDPEGYLLTETRKLVGPDVPIVITLDLHGILTERMLRQIDGLAIYHTYPHVDFASTGARAARVLHRLVTDKSVRPIIARVTIPALVRGDELITKSGCYGSLIREARRLELEGVAMSAGIMIGNPFTDVPELCCQVIIATDGQADVAQQQALQLAREFWPLRQRMQGKFSSLDRAIAQARSIAGPVIFTDAADATSSGATGDSNLILQGLREAAYPKKVLAQIVDPEAAAAAHRGGVGATVQVTLGGAIDPARFVPMPVTARVQLLSDGQARLETMKIGLDAGPTAVLTWDNFTVVVFSKTLSLFDRAMYFANGLNPQDFDLIVVKSPHTEHHMFEAWADCNFNVDVAGATSANLPTLGHTICARPIYPLDPDVGFDPQVALYERR
ncbi:MAG: M81 family metallopeptidase, partial [Rhodoferax sp.]|nr:M81 family metallopeptidase [Rhodoferax sp.]MBP9932010.1 M81 family metallopeptidase [Rhodoferax sp.]